MQSIWFEMKKKKLLQVYNERSAKIKKKQLFEYVKKRESPAIDYQIYHEKYSRQCLND